jgi:hypothetical protein
MAENDNTGAAAPREDLAVSVAAMLFEGRIGLEAALAGLASLALRYPQEPLKSELDIVARFVQQSAEAFEALVPKLCEVLPLRGLQS